MEIQVESVTSSQVLMKNEKLWEAFKNRNEKNFDKLLEIGANPDEMADQNANLSTFELLCKEPDASDYIIKCLDWKADPNRANPYDGHYPIHHAVQSLAVQNIKILLKADPECVNQTLNFNMTPLHLITKVLNDSNLSTVYEVIKIFSESDGHFSWPARQSDNQTPFSMLLERLTKLKDKETCSEIIKYLMGKYPKIDMFQRENCAKIILQNFAHLVDEYKVIENRNEHDDNKHFSFVLEKLIVENEAEFLVKFDSQKINDADHHLKGYSATVLIHLAIKHNKFESFVEMYEMNHDNHSLLETLLKEVLSFDRNRMLKHLLNHSSVKKVDAKWMINILSKMKDKECDIDPCTRRCFHILLDHPKYDVNEQISDRNNTTALHFAATSSEYATIELLKSGASLGICNDDGQMAIQLLENSVLKKHFDSCITTCVPEKRSDIDCFMVIDYSFLKASKEMPPIEYMTKTKDVQPLIEHPVIASFLFLKWLRLSNIFYLNFLLLSLNSITFSIYLFLFYANQVHQNSTNHFWLQVSKIFAFGAFIIFLLKEATQFVSSPTRYLKSAENYFEVGVICLMAITLMKPYEDQHIYRSIAAVLYLGFAIEFTVMFDELPMLSGFNYIVMLKTVAVNFLRTLAFFSIILLAFALSFCTLIRNPEDSSEYLIMTGSNETDETKYLDQSNNHDMFSIIFHVVLMLTGDLQNISDGVTNITIGRIILIVFVFSMSIVLMNLLVGLTVSDTAMIKNEAYWNTLRGRVKLLRKYECMAWNCLRVLTWNEKFLPMIQLMPDYLPLNKIKVEISKFDSNKWIYIPKFMKDDNGEELKIDIDGDPFPLYTVKTRVLSGFGFWKIPLQMDEQVIESGMKVIGCNQEMKAKREKEKYAKIYSDDIKKRLDQLKEQQSLKAKEMEQKLENIAKEMEQKLENIAKEMEQKLETISNQIQSWIE